MSKTIDLSFSWAIVTAPLSLIIFKPVAPSRPMPVRTTPTAFSRYTFAVEWKRWATEGFNSPCSHQDLNRSTNLSSQTEHFAIGSSVVISTKNTPKTSCGVPAETLLWRLPMSFPGRAVRPSSLQLSQRSRGEREQTVDSPRSISLKAIRYPRNKLPFLQLEGRRGHLVTQFHFLIANGKRYTGKGCLINFYPGFFRGRAYLCQ